MKKSILMVFFILAAILLFAACEGGKAASGMRQSEATVSGNFGSQSGSQHVPQPGDQPESQPANAMDTRPVALYPAQNSYIGDSKWGYINPSGKFVLKPEYSSAMRFQENGLAVVGRGGKTGVIDTRGSFVIEPVYDDIGEFSGGRTVAVLEGKFCVIDEKGKILSDKYSFVGKYKEGRASFQVAAENGELRYGYLGENGQPVIQPIYTYTTDFDEGIAVVSLPGGGYAILDRNGKTVKTLKFNYVGNASEGMIPFAPYQDGKNGYLNSRGDVAIEPSFLIAEAFQEGTAAVNAAPDYSVNRYGLIDKKGKYRIKPQYNEILHLGEGMVAVGLAIDPKNSFAGSKYALAAQDGSILTDFLYYGLDRFHNGVVSVYDDTSTFFLDKRGRRVETLPTVKGIGSMELLDGLIYADIDQRPYYMNRQGEIVYRPESTVTLKNGVKVSEEIFRPNRNYLVYYPVLGSLKDLKVQEAINTRLRDMWIDRKIKPTDNLDYNYEGEFMIGFNRKDLLELEKSAYDYPFGAAHGMPVMEYAHVDTRTGTFYHLEDLFQNGSNYVKVLSDILEKQIKEHGEEMGVWPDSYKGIKPDQPFYLSGDALMLYFEPYEIAPYAAGFPTFTVPFDEISNIIDKKGSFWQSFH